MLKSCAAVIAGVLLSAAAAPNGVYASDQKHKEHGPNVRLLRSENDMMIVVMDTQ